VHTGFKVNFENLWFGQKGILEHLKHPEKIHKDYDYNKKLNDQLCGSVTFRRVYCNDIVPHLPPLSTGSFDHVGPEYRYHPVTGWKKRTGDFRFKHDRCTQVASILATAPFAVLDGISWFDFWRGEHRDWPIIGILSRSN
jgi:hypothetical protein